jgi:HPt (histidine-containing phosphotransfer) domain-containing protein
MMASQDADSVVSEVFDDHEVLHPPHRLAKALATAGAAASLDLGAIARAEKALAALAGEFAAWMSNEVKVLDAARAIVLERGLTEETRAALFRAAHDIKGEAATFGYPLAGRIAGGLCRLLDEIGSHDAVPLVVVDRHVDAVRAVVRQDVRGDEDRMALALATRLDELVTAAVAQAGSGAA